MMMFSFSVLLFFCIFFFTTPLIFTEFVSTEINFDFNRAVGQDTCSCGLRSSTPPPKAPINIRFTAFIDNTQPKLSKLLCDSYSLAIHDLNAFSQSQEQNVNFNLTVEDTHGNGTYAALKAEVAAERGVSVILGPVNPEEETILIPTAVSLGLTTISATSIYPYSLPGQQSFRLTSNIAHQANTMAFFLKSRGIQVGLVVFKATSYGTIFQEKFRKAWQNIGGNATYTVAYPAVTTPGFNISGVLAQVETKLKLVLAYANQARGAIIWIGEEEWPTYAAAVKSPLLLRQLWLGDIGVNRVRSPGRAAVDFASMTQFFSINTYIPLGSLKTKVKTGLMAKGYNQPDSVGYLAYDSVILAGYTYFSTRSFKNPSFSSALSSTAEYFYGSSGRLAFDNNNNKQYSYYSVDQLDSKTGSWKLVTVFDPLPTVLKFIPPF